MHFPDNETRLILPKLERPVFEKTIGPPSESCQNPDKQALKAPLQTQMKLNSAIKPSERHIQARSRKTLDLIDQLVKSLA